MTVYVVCQHNGGAWEPNACWSIWSTQAQADTESARLNALYNESPDSLADYAYYVVPVDLDQPFNNGTNIE